MLNVEPDPERCARLVSLGAKPSVASHLTRVDPQDARFLQKAIRGRRQAPGSLVVAADWFFQTRRRRFEASVMATLLHELHRNTGRSVNDVFLEAFEALEVQIGGCQEIDINRAWVLARYLVAGRLRLTQCPSCATRLLAANETPDALLDCPKCQTIGVRGALDKPRDLIMLFKKHHIPSHRLPMALGQEEEVKAIQRNIQEDLAHAMAEAGEGELKAIAMDWPDLDRAFHRAAQYTNGMTLPGKEKPILVEALVATRQAYLNSKKAGDPEEVCSKKAALALAGVMADLLTTIRVSFNAGAGWQQWSPLQDRLSPYWIIHKRKGSRVRVDQVSSREGVPPARKSACQLVIASRLFDMPLLDRVGLLDQPCLTG